MRIRSFLFTVPACAAAGAATYSFVAAQEQAPPAGYYQGRISQGQVSNLAPAYIRPMNGMDPSFAPTAPVTGAMRPPVAASAIPPANLGNGANVEQPRLRITPPVVVGPAPTPVEISTSSVPVRQVGNNEPALPAPKVFFPDAQPAPSTGTGAGITPPSLNANTAAAANTGNGGGMPPPRIVESEPKPLPLVPPISMTPNIPAPSLASANAPAPSTPSTPPGPLPTAPSSQMNPSAPILPTIAPVPTAPSTGTPASTSAPGNLGTPLPNIVPLTPSSPSTPINTTPSNSTSVTPPTALSNGPSNPGNATPVVRTNPPLTSAPIALPSISNSSQSSPSASFSTSNSVPLLPSAATVFPSNVILASRAMPAVTLEVDAPKEIGIGQHLNYDLVVRNSGANPVMNVRVEDELPVGAKLISSEPAAEQSMDRLSWNLGSLEANGEKRIKITVQPAEEGEIRTRAVVSFASAAESRVKVTRPQVAVNVTGVETSRVGDDIVFNIRVSNTGTGQANRVLIQAKLSDGLHRPEGSTIEAEVPNLPAGESKPVTLKVLATKAGPQTCTVVAIADGQPAEISKQTVNVVEPQLQTKLIGPGKCLVRSEPEFKIELSNPGTAATDPVQLWAMIPDGFEFVGAGDGGTFQTVNRTVNWRLTGIAPGTTRTVAVKLRAASPSEGSVKIVAQASPNSGDVQTVGGRNVRPLESKSETQVRAEGVPALRFEVIDLEDPVEVGKEAMYEIKVANQGTGPCTNVRITANLAEGMVATGVTGVTQGRGAGQQVVFDPIPQLSTKGEAVFRVRVKGTLAGDQRFRVQVECDQIRTPIVKEENTRFYKE